MPLKLSNNAIGTLVSSMTNSSTSVVLAPGQGTKFPVLESGDWFPITVVRASNPNQFEIMHATARSGDILTVTRAREGTTAITFSVGDVVEHRLTKDALDRDFVRLSPDSLEGARLSVSNDGSNLKTSVHAGGKEEQLARQKDIDSLGTAATHDVTTNRIDINPDRILRAQDYGLGLPIHQKGTDLDSLVVSAQYSMQNPVNGPDFGPVSWIYLEVIAHSINRNYALQRAYPLNSFSVNGYGEAYRVRMNGTWHPWQYNMPQSSKDVALEYTGDGGLIVRTLNNNGSSIFSARSSGGGEGLTVHHGANPLRGGNPAGDDANWYIGGGLVWHQNNMPRVQGTGQSTAAVMSQKAVTDAINNINTTPPTNAGGVGTYAFVIRAGSSSSNQINWNQTVAGSGLRPASIELSVNGGSRTPYIQPSAIGLSGTWRIMGFRTFSYGEIHSGNYAPTLAVRIS